MRSVFVGAVEGSAIALRALCRAGHPPDLIVTLPLEKSANHSDFADLGVLADEYAITLHRTARSDAPQTLQMIAALRPDLIVIIGWSQLVGAEFRALARLGVLGFHPAPLPRLRGRAVIPWQILTGQRQGGATLFWIDEGTDSGDIAAQSLFGIDPDTITARVLYDRAVSEMAALLPPLMDRLAAGERPAVPQDHARASICARRRPQDGVIDWSQPAEQIERLIRAVGPPYPGALTASSRGPITVTAARLHPRPGYYIGLPGQVQEITDQVITVMCGDGFCLDLTGWQADAPPARHAMLNGGA